MSAKAPVKGTQCVKKNLESDTKFEVRIRGVNDAGSSGWSRVTVMATGANQNSTPTGSSTASAGTALRPPSGCSHDAVRASALYV